MVKLDGYELIIGNSLDPQFGPVLLFGTGGQLVEVFKDRALGLPPLNTTLARRIMEQTRILTALERGARAPAGGSRRARAASGPLQPPGRRAALDQGDRHQSLARLAGSPAGAGRAGDRPRAECRASGNPPARHPPVPDPVHHPLVRQGRLPAHPPAHPPRGRTLAGQVPRHALRAERRAPLLPRDEIKHACRARAADPASASSITTAPWSW